MRENEMHPKTIAALEQLRTLDWFCNVGIVDTQEAKILSSWDEAIKSVSSFEWENFEIDRTGDFTEFLSIYHTNERNKWNKKIDETKPAIEDILINKNTFLNKLPKDITDSVKWHILGYLMELEYSDICQPGFLSRQADWYFKGHFPCGWEGEWPGGRPIIY